MSENKTYWGSKETTGGGSVFYVYVTVTSSSFNTSSGVTDLWYNVGVYVESGTLSGSLLRGKYGQEFNVYGPGYYEYANQVHRTVDRWGSIHFSEEAGYTGGSGRHYSSSLEFDWYPNPPQYSLSYNANGGTGAPATQYKYWGDGGKISTTKPTRDLYDFVEWNTSADGTGEHINPGENWSSNRSLTLYAKWKLAYVPPTATLGTVFRANADGTAADEGTRVHVRATGKADTQVHTNAVKSLVIQYRESGASTWNTLTSSSSTTATCNIDFTSGATPVFAIEKQYEFRAVVTDTYGPSISAPASQYTRATGASILPKAFFTMDFLHGGHGVAFGTPAIAEGLEVAMDTRLNGATTRIRPEHIKLAEGFDLYRMGNYVLCSVCGYEPPNRLENRQRFDVEIPDGWRPINYSIGPVTTHSSSNYRVEIGYPSKLISLYGGAWDRGVPIYFTLGWIAAPPSDGVGSVGEATAAISSDALKKMLANVSQEAQNGLLDAYHGMLSKGSAFAKAEFDNATVTTSQSSKAQVELTTHGSPVVILLSGDINPTSDGGWVNVVLTRDGVPLKGNTYESIRNSMNTAIVQSFMDTPIAGKHVYKVEITSGSGSHQLNENTDWQEKPQLMAFEVASNVDEHVYETKFNLTQMGGGFMAGQITQYAGSTPPAGWLFCDGAAYSRTKYAELFKAIGTTYGAGDGSTTFNVPDLRGRFPYGMNGSYPLNAKGGEITHKLTIAEMPSHNHELKDQEYNSGAGGAGSKMGEYPVWLYQDHEHNWGGADVITKTGGGQAHNNMPPYIALNYIICAVGTANAQVLPSDAKGIMDALGISMADWVVARGNETTTYDGNTITWTWRKWSSGVAECWGRSNQRTVDITDSWTSNLYESTTKLRFKYPTGLFNSKPTLEFSDASDGVTGYDILQWIIGNQEPSIATAQLSPNLYALYPQSVSADVSVFIRATGTWR